MDISTIASALKLPKKAYFLGGIISGLLLFSKDDFLKQLSLFDFKESYTLWIGIAFLLSTGISIIAAFEFIMEKYKAYSQKKEETANKKQAELENEQRKAAIISDQKNKLKKLDNYEKAILREFYISEKNTAEMSCDDPAVIGLVKKGVIKQVGSQGYSTNFTGFIAFFRADDVAVEYFESFEFPELASFPRPAWIEGIRTKEAYERKVAEYGKMIQRL